ncbi:MAG: hypothetical protein AAFV53_37910 [Myxococcota bacterium]
MSIHLPHHSLRLDTLPPETQRRFLDELAQVLARIHHPDVSHKSGMVKGEINLKITIEYGLDTRAHHLSYGVTSKAPACREVSHAAVYDEKKGELYIPQPDETGQPNLFLPNTPQEH